MPEECAVFVDDGRDPLVDYMLREGSWHDLATIRIPARTLAVRRIAVSTDTVRLEGSSVAVAVFRASPSTDFAADFPDPDRAFCSQEARAVWLCILAHPGVLAVNRGDADTWYYSSEWSIWNLRMRAAGVRTTEVSIGVAPSARPVSWLCWGGGIANPPSQLAANAMVPALLEGSVVERVIVCAGEVIEGVSSDTTNLAAAVLMRYGAILAELWLDEQGDVVGANTRFPLTPAAASRVGPVLLRWIHATLRHRR